MISIVDATKRPPQPYNPPFYFAKVISTQRRLRRPRAWTRAAAFSTNHCQLTLQAGERRRLRFHYPPPIKSTRGDNTLKGHSDKLGKTVDFGSNKSQMNWIVL